MGFREITLEKYPITLKVAKGFFEKAKGLLGVTFLPIDSGMVFVFKNENYWSMHTLRMQFPIDIVWVSQEGEVVDIIKNVPPAGIFSKVVRPIDKARYVVELNAYTTDRHSITQGTQLFSKQEVEDLGR